MFIMKSSSNVLPSENRFLLEKEKHTSEKKEFIKNTIGVLTFYTTLSALAIATIITLAVQRSQYKCSDLKDETLIQCKTNYKEWDGLFKYSLLLMTFPLFTCCLAIASCLEYRKRQVSLIKV